MGNKQSMEDTLFELRMASKTMERESKKCEKKEKENIAKVKKAIQQGNREGAQIYAQNAIREKNQALNHLRMASRIDAVASRVQSAVQMNSLTKNMKGVTVGMDKTISNMNVDELAKVMDKFEKQFEDLDVKGQYMEDAIGNTTATMTPANQVDQLIAVVADENNLELGQAFSDLGPLQTGIQKNEAEKEAPNADDLEARLAALR